MAGLVCLAGALMATSAGAAGKSIVLQPTTSIASSGLYDYILPMFTDKIGIQVNVMAAGTGQAIKNARNGDGDVLLVHAKAAEEQFVAEGYGDFRIVVEGDKSLFNPYGVILINPDKHPKVKLTEGQAFIDWIHSDEGQSAIAGYQLDGQQLFFPNAGH